MSRFYYHGVQDDEYGMLKILIDGEIKSQRLQGKNISRGLNGLDYVCICNKFSDSFYEENKEYDEAFDVFIKNCFGFIISDDIEVIKCKVYKKMTFAEFLDIENQLSKGLSIGLPITDMIDEFRVKDRITLDKIIGICIPVDELSYCDINIVKKILSIACITGLDIVDSSKQDFIEEYENYKVNDVYNNNCLIKKIRRII